MIINHFIRNLVNNHIALSDEINKVVLRCAPNPNDIQYAAKVQRIPSEFSIESLIKKVVLYLLRDYLFDYSLENPSCNFPTEPIFFEDGSLIITMRKYDDLLNDQLIPQ